MRLHLDTDLGGDPDDACALAMVLGWPGAELVGVTTTADPDGRRAGCVAALLGLAGRPDVPLAVGAGASMTTGEPMGDLPDDERYWGRKVAPRRTPPGAALDLLADAVEQGATIVAIGPATNLALLETLRPGSLARVPVVLMGGWTGPLDDDLPRWGADRDWNVRCDTRAAEIVAAAAADLTLVPLAVTLRAPLRAVDLPRLRAAGPLGALLARQARAYAADQDKGGLGRAHRGLPDDLLNIQHDPLTCAVALGWPGVTVEDVRLRTVLDGGALRFERAEQGQPTRLVTAADGDAFGAAWLEAVDTAWR